MSMMAWGVGGRGGAARGRGGAEPDDISLKSAGFFR